MLELLESIENLPEEIIIESQRGIAILGYSLYSSRLLFPRFDPPQFQLYNKKDKKLVDIVVNRLSANTPIDWIFPLKLSEDSHWHLDDSRQKWFVLMDYNGKMDSDDQGWFYSWRFNHRTWKCKNGIVRRRIWIRTDIIH